MFLSTELLPHGAVRLHPGQTKQAGAAVRAGARRLQPRERAGGGRRPLWSLTSSPWSRQARSGSCPLQVMLHRRLWNDDKWALDNDLTLNDSSVVHPVLWLLLGPRNLTSGLRQRSGLVLQHRPVVMLREMNGEVGGPSSAPVITAPGEPPSRDVAELVPAGIWAPMEQRVTRRLRSKPLLVNVGILRLKSFN